MTQNFSLDSTGPTLFYCPTIQYTLNYNREDVKATPGCLLGSSAPLITRLFHCHKQLCWTIIIPWAYIVMVLSVCQYVADEPPLPYSSNRLHHLYRSQIVTCSSVRKVLVPKFHSILTSFNRPP